MGRVQERIYREIFFLKAIKMPKLKSFIDWSKGTPQSRVRKQVFRVDSPSSFFAENEQEKINRFMAGLNPAVRTIVTSASHTRYGQLVEAATRVEQSAQTALKSKSQFNQKRNWIGSHQGEASKMPKSGQRQAWSQSRQQS